MSTSIPSNIANRLKYTDGMFLTASLMTTDQNYFINTIALQNRMLYTAGVLEGLQVTQVDAATLSIAAGGGFDDAGDFLILPTGGGNAFVVPKDSVNPSLVYLTKPTTPSVVSGNVVDAAGVLKLQAKGMTPPANSIVLAEIALDTQGQITAVTDCRVAVTSRLGQAPAVSPAATELSVAESPVSGSSTVHGDVTIPADQVPLASKPYVATVYYNSQHAPAFVTTPKVIAQVTGDIPYPVAVSVPADRGTVGFTLTVGASPITPATGETQVIRIQWWAFS